MLKKAACIAVAALIAGISASGCDGKLNLPRKPKAVLEEKPPYSARNSQYCPIEHEYLKGDFDSDGKQDAVFLKREEGKGILYMLKGYEEAEDESTAEPFEEIALSRLEDVLAAKGSIKNGSNDLLVSVIGPQGSETIYMFENESGKFKLHSTYERKRIN